MQGSSADGKRDSDDIRDVIVIGGGPAGLGAAIRLVWGDISEQIRMRGLVLEASALLGGLTRWKPMAMACHGHFFTKRDLKRLIHECRKRDIEIRTEEPARALKRRNDGVFEVTTDTSSYASHAVVIATGMRRSFEPDGVLFQRHRGWWFREDAELPGLLSRIGLPDGKSIAIVGSARIERLIEPLKLPAQTGAGEVHWIAESPEAAGGHPAVRYATLLDADIENDRVRLRLGKQWSNTGDQLDVDSLVIDFRSYELEGTSIDFALGVELECADGFVKADERGYTNVEGIFAAGDAAGAPFAVASALHRGMVAGYAAYTYVYEKRFKKRPDLYPYYAGPMPHSTK